MIRVEFQMSQLTIVAALAFVDNIVGAAETFVLALFANKQIPTIYSIKPHIWVHLLFVHDFLTNLHRTEFGCILVAGKALFTYCRSVILNQLACRCGYFATEATYETLLAPFALRFFVPSVWELFLRFHQFTNIALPYLAHMLTIVT